MADRLAPGDRHRLARPRRVSGRVRHRPGPATEHSLAVRLPSEGWRSLELDSGLDRSRSLGAGTGRAFGEHHVHEVLNESPAEHAISVHAYYPPLPLIRRYSRSGPVLNLEHVERPADWQ